MNLTNNGNEQLRSQVYQYLRHSMMQGTLKPGSSIKTAEIIKELGISRTPVRDALIRLEAEGFVTILPQRGVLINSLSFEDAQDICEILGGLESKVISLVFHKIGAREIAEFMRLNQKMMTLVVNNTSDFNEYNECNIKFHDIFLNLCENQMLLKHIRILKRRLYDFPNRDYGKLWQHRNVTEHQKFVLLIEEGDVRKATDFIRDVHWTDLVLPESSLGSSQADKIT